MENSRAQITSRIWSRAMRDPQFREALKEDPKTAITKDLGIELPEGIKVQVSQAPKDTLVLVIPPFQDEVQPQSVPDQVEVAIREALLSTMSCSCTNARTCY